jgi:hypothetical protein
MKYLNLESPSCQAMHIHASVKLLNVLYLQ